MPDSREGRGEARPLWRALLALAVAPMAIALLSAEQPSPELSPTPTASPTPTPTPTAGATLQITKTDPSGQPIKVAGVTFEVRETVVGQQAGPPIQVMTNDNGVAVARNLQAGHRYCVKELTAPPDYQLAPSFTPLDGCNFAPGTLLAADPPANTPTPSPSASPSPTPSATPAPTGELQITKVDTSNKTITVPGFTFNIHVGSAGGQVIATIATDGTGMAVAGALNPAMYCVEETSAPDGYEVAPVYSPAACVNVASDATQGRAPTTVTVVDPAAATPTPTDAAGAGTAPSPSATPHAAQAPAAQPPSSPAAALARGLIGVGVLLLLAGAVMIVVAIRRRRQPPPAATPPTDYWYDSTIT